MFHKFVSLVLMSALLSLTLVMPAMAQQQGQTVSRMKQTVQKAMEKDKEITVVLKHQRNGKTRLKGKVKQLTDEGLTLDDLKTGEQTQLAFDEINEIRGKPSHIGLIVALAVVAGVAIAVLVAINTLGKNS
jgi:Flp pilus assembly protein TadB